MVEIVNYQKHLFEDVKGNKGANLQTVWMALSNYGWDPDGFTGLK